MIKRSKANGALPQHRTENAVTKTTIKYETVSTMRDEGARGFVERPAKQEVP